MQITVKVEGVEEALEKFNARTVERAMISTLNETVKSTLTLASKLIRNERGFKILKSDFDKRVKIDLARRGSYKAALTASRISASTGRFTGNDSFALPYFGAKEAQRFSGGVRIKSRKGVKIQKRTGMGSGVSVQVLRGGRTARFPKAFIATMKSGHIGVFRRIEAQSLKTHKTMIREIKVVTLATMFRGTLPRLAEYAQNKFKERFAGKLDWVKNK